MTTQYTPILKLALPVTGELSGTWGDVVNDNITSMVEQAVAGLATINTWTTNAHTLTTASGTSSESRCAMLVAADGAGGSALTGAGEIICPAASKLYVLKNGSSYAITLKTSGGTGVAVPSAQTAFLFCDGTNVNACVTTVVNGVISGNLTVNGNTTLGDAATDTITATARFNTDLLPSTDNARDLGSSGNSWRTLYCETSVIAANITISGNTISSTDTNGNITLAPNGTGDVQLDADTIRVGDSGANVTITSNGAGDLILNTNSGTNSGSITIEDGANGNITVATNGTGDVYLDADTVRIGDSNANATLTTNGTGDLILNTNAGTNSGSITIADGANGNITISTNGTGITTMTTAVEMSATTQNIALGTSQTSGTWTAGGAAQTGNITLDQSTKAHTLNIGTGATESAATKTINFGTAGVSGSTTTIAIGSAAGATGLTINAVSTITPVARTSGAASYFTLTTPADTNQTASTEAIGASFTAATRTWANGNITTQRERVFAAPTYAFLSAPNSTITTAINVDIATPAAGTNANITNAYALRAGASLFTDSITVNGNTTLGDASGDTLTINGTAVSTPNGLNFDSDTLVIDAANNRVGVGIASPITSLDVRDGVGSILTLGNTGTFIAGESSYLKFREASTALAEVGWEADFNELRINNRVAFTSFYVANAEKMRLASAVGGVGALGIGYTNLTSVGNSGLAVLGNVGIGTNSPQGPLEVAATGATVNQFLTGGTGNNAVTGIFRIGSGSGRGASIQGFRGGSSNIHSLDFYTYNSADVFGMRLDSSGNLGIGTLSPNYIATLYKASLPVLQLANSTSGSTAADGLLIYLNGANATISNEEAGSIGFQTSGTLRATLDAAGNLGLGVTPSAWGAASKAIQFGAFGSIAGSTGNFAGIATNRYNDGANKYIGTGLAALYEQGNGVHAWYIAPSGTAGNAISFTQAMTLDASGNLVIGNTSANTKLEIAGNNTGVTANNTLRFTDLDTSTEANQQIGKIEFYSSDSSGSGANVKAYIGAFAEDTTPDGYLAFATGESGAATERARITSAGNLLFGQDVVIGQNTADGSDSRAVYLCGGAEQTVGRGANIRVYGNEYSGEAGNTRIFSGNIANSEISLNAYTSTSVITLLTNNTERARITSGGDLLVGVTSVTIGTRFEAANSSGSAGALVTSQVGDYTLYSYNKATSGDNSFINFGTEASFTSRGTITYNRAGGLVAYNTTSDYRAKDILGPVIDTGATIDALKVYNGKMKGATVERPMLIAHEAQAVTPYAVTGEKDAVNDDGTPKYQQMDVSSLVPLLIAEIQSLRARVAQLEQGA